MTAFAIGDTVLRREDRPERRATVLEIDTGADEPVYHLAYAEGGDGWWPASAIEAAA
jgi:hypothetical protein